MRLFSTKEELSKSFKELGILFLVLFCLAAAKSFVQWVGTPSDPNSNASSALHWTTSNLEFFAACLFMGLISYWIRRKAAVHKQDGRGTYYSFFAKSRLIVPRGIRQLNLVAIGCLVVAATFNMGNLYFKIIHVVVCAVALITIYLMERRKNVIWLCLFAVIALTFNPFVRMGVSGSDWVLIDSSTALVLIPCFMFLVSAGQHEGQLKPGEDTAQ